MALPGERADEVMLLECNLDDMTPEALGYALERVLAAGALDAWFTPIYMKKNRPATLLAVLCRPEDGAALRGLLLRETTTLGVRYQTLQREVAERRSDAVQTPWGRVRRKLKLLGGRIVSVKPEYDDCARLAREQGVPLQEVMRAALDARPEGEPQ
jgi:pyridinium-3,5-bisthiocarboxylic acid mononucleotide nickel chelatase